jgi:hypothetical protein
MTKQRLAFIASALKAEKEVMETGLVYDAEEVFSYITAKVGGTPVTRPHTRPIQLVSSLSAYQTKA